MTIAPDITALQHEIDLTSGMAFAGCRPRQDKFVFTVPLARLVQIAGDPVKAEDPRFARYGDEHMRRYAEVRSRVQRALDTAKLKNADDFTTYLAEAIRGVRGRGWSAPAVALYSPEPIKVAEVNLGFGLVTYVGTIPWGQIVVVLDGETQYISLRRLYENPTQYGVTAEQIASFDVVVELYHGLAGSDGEQIFHDRNTKGVKPNASNAALRDNRDPVTQLVKRLMSDVIVTEPGTEITYPLGDFVETAKRQVGKRSGKWVLFTSLRQFAIGMLLGPEAANRGVNDAVPADKMPKVAEDLWRAAIRDIVDMLFRRFAEDFSTFDTMIARPAMMTALGILAHRTTPWYTGDKPLSREGLVDLLSQVDWNRRVDIWGGVVGVNKSGKLSSEGAKGNTRKLVAALEDPDSDEGRQIRGLPVRSPSA